MPNASGGFSGNISIQSIANPTDQPNHQMVLGEVRGLQKSADPLWNNSHLGYWGYADLIGGHGTQRGYFANQHPNGDMDLGTFEGNVIATPGEIRVEGTFKFTGGTGSLKGITGGGTFETRSTPAGAIEGSWKMAYEVAGAAAAGR